MRRAIELGELGWGHVAPNPMVGCVVVADGAIVGEGYHARFGGEHAEVAALRAAGARAAGSTLYVNLEPCAHRGKTPPCDEAIRRAGVREVVIACRDPNAVAAGGLERLESSGVRVRLGTSEVEARRLNAPFLWSVTQDLPFVAVKLAVSLDGRIAAAPGVRTAVTGAEAREAVHRLRAGFDAVLVGRGTVVADDPMLTVRNGRPPRVAPIRVVTDTRLALPSGNALVRSVDDAPVWVLAAHAVDTARREALEAAGVRVFEVAGSEKGIDLKEGLGVLKACGVGAVLVEGGAELASSLLREGLVHRLYLFIAPIFLGERGVPAFADAGPSSLEDWEVADRQAVGRDTLIVLENQRAMATLGASGAA